HADDHRSRQPDAAPRRFRWPRLRRGDGDGTGSRIRGPTRHHLGTVTAAAQYGKRETVDAGARGGRRDKLRHRTARTHADTAVLRDAHHSQGRKWLPSVRKGRRGLLGLLSRSEWGELSVVAAKVDLSE